MYFVNNRLKMVLILTVTFFSGMSLARGPFTMEISALQTRIKVGEPLIVDLDHYYQQPQIYEWMEKIKTSISIRDFRLEVLDVNDKAPPRTFGLMPIKLTLQGTEGLKYKGTFDVFFVDTVGLVFDQPGTHNVCILTPSGKLSSNSLVIVVEPPSEAEEKALSFFTGLEDFVFLMGGIFKNETTVSHLEQVVEQCRNTMLGKWSAARLGIEERKELAEKHPTEKFISEYRAGLVREPLVEKARSHLVKALELPDEFPIRQEVLYHLIGIEILKGNNNTALYYANELSQKYPKGDFGKNVSVAKLQEEIVRLEARLAELAQQRREKLEELANWLEQLWLTDEELQKTIEPNQWREFTETVREQAESRD